MAQESAIQRKRGSEICQAEETRSGWHYRPHVDIVEHADELTLHMDMPGADAKKVDIRYENGLLSLHGMVEPRQPEDTRYLMREYGVGNFHRTFQIGETIDDSKITAEYRDGVLVVHLPKTEAVKPRKIAVRTT